MNKEILTEEARPDDLNIRPSSFDQYVGQEDIKTNLIMMIKAAKLRDQSLDHILLHGPAGLCYFVNRL